MKGDIFRFASLVLVVPALIFGLSGAVLAVQGDLVEDNYIDWFDLDVLAEKWLNDCNGVNNWCDGADIDHSSKADFDDFGLLGQGWRAVPEPNLIGHWNFNEGLGGTVYDSSGNDNDGTLNGDPNWVAGKVGSYALDFDGDGDYVLIPEDPSLDFTLCSFTFAAWINPHMKNQHIFSHYASSSTRKAIHIKTYESGLLRFAFYADDLNTSTGAIPFDSWSYIVCIYDYGSDTSSIYINGEPNVTGNNGPYEGARVDSWIGKSWTSDRDFDGTIDDVRIYNRALTAEEVGELYQEGNGYKAFKPNPVNGAVDVDPNVVLSWSAGYWANSHDVYFGTDYNDVNDATPGSAEFMGNQEPNSYTPGGLMSETTYYWRIDEKNGAGTVKGDVWSFTTLVDIVSWWKFDEEEGTVAYDSAGSNHGTLMNNPTWTTGQIDGALSFDGMNEYVEVTPDSRLNVQRITMSAWAKVDDAAPALNNFILNRKMTQAGTYILRLEESNSKWLAQVRLNGSESTARIIDSDNVATTGWTYICGTYDGDKLKLYINAVLQANVDDTDGTIDTDNPDILTIAAHPDLTQYFDGRIDDVRIYGRALSTEEIEELYRQGLGGKAFKPNPVDGAIDVEPSVVLSWSPGEDALSHDVYFGTDYNDVNDATTGSAEFMGNQEPNSYTPGGLMFETTYYWRIDEESGGGAGTVKGDIWSFTVKIDPALVGWWKLDETSGGVAYDSSGSGNNGWLYYYVTWVPTGGKINGAAGFHETGNEWEEYGQIEISTADISTSAGTIALWAYPAAQQTSDWRFMFGTKNNDGNRIQLYMKTGMWLDIGLGDTPYRDEYICNLAKETWHHIALTWNGSNYVVYVNGNDKASGSYTGLGTLSSTANIGNNGDAIWNDRFQVFPGLIDDARIWNRVLVADEVRHICGEDAAQPEVIASNPNPSDGATDVDVDWFLIWSAGDYAASHDVYLGTDYNDVNNADNVGSWPEYKGNQTSTTFEPGGFEYGTAYCWRIDEVNGVDVWKGKVWSFTTKANPPLPGQASNPSPPNEVNDVSVFANLSWTIGSYAASHDVYFGTDFNDVNDANDSWPVATGPNDPNVYKGNQLSTIFNPGTMDVNTTYYWRIDEKNVTGTTIGNIWEFTTEVSPSAPEKATDPYPSQLAIDVDTGDNPSWTAGDGATSQDVYFGTNFNDVNNATGPNTLPGRGNQISTTFDPGIMDANTTYYWRIDERNPVGVTRGDVWSFTTRTQLGEEELAPWYVFNQDWDPNGDKTASLNSFNGVHPRYMLTQARVNDLKIKINDPNCIHHRIWNNIIKPKADVYKDQDPPSAYASEDAMRSAGRGIPWMALAYLLSDDPNYLAGAEHWMSNICGYPHWDGNHGLGAGECLFGISVGYDWLYHNLTEPNRNTVRDKLIYQARRMHDWASKGERWLANHNHIEHNGLGAAGFALYDDPSAYVGAEPNAMDWIGRSDLVFQMAFLSGSHDGSYTDGHQYWGYSIESLLCYTEAAKDLMDTNYYNNNKWLENAANFIIFSTIPDFDIMQRHPGYSNCVMSFGDSHRDYRSHGPTHFLNLLASRYDNGFAQWLADRMLDEGVGITEEFDYRAWANLLWYDEGVQPVPIANLSTFRHFDDMGWVTSRSGWDEDAIMVGFKCGSMHGHKVQPYYELQVDEDWPGTKDPNMQELYGRKYHEINGGHNHPDVGSFQIYAHGKWLATDPGYTKPKWTSDHCTILTNGIGQLGERNPVSNSNWFDRTEVIDAKAKSSIIKAESCADYDYIIGDAENIYRDPNLTKFYRHFIYIKPDLVVIADELEASVSSDYFEWRLRTTHKRPQFVDNMNIAEQDPNEYYIIENNNDSDVVVMDVHFIHPDLEGFSAGTEGSEFLKVNFDSTGSDLLATVLHPRRDEEPASSIVSSSFVDSVLYLTIGIGAEEIDVELNLAAQEVNID